MSEKSPNLEAQEALPSPEQHELLTARAQERFNQAEQAPRLSTQEARKAAVEIQTNETTLNPLEQLAAAEKSAQPHPPMHVDKSLRSITLRRELMLIRRQLSLPARTLSKIIHQPAIRAVSEGAGKTVSRPSGLLGGGLVALFGTSGYLYLAHHMGFSYNYGVFILLFVGGFLFGLLLEWLVYLSLGRRRK